MDVRDLPLQRRPREDEGEGEAYSGYYAAEDISPGGVTHAFPANDALYIGKVVEDPLVKQRAKQACDKCRAKKCAVITLPRVAHELVHWGQLSARM